MLIQAPLPSLLSQRMACHVLNINRGTLRAHKARDNFCGPVLPQQHRAKRNACQQANALSIAEREHVNDILSSEAYCNQPPMQVYHQLLQTGQYLCSVSTMHRILREQALQGERRHQRAPQSHAIPRLSAATPNEVWTWDIAKLATQQRGEYLSLYVVMDLFSRYIVAWMLSRKENSALSSQLMQDAAQRYDIPANSLTLHQDRGVPMTAHCYLDLLSELAITASHSRPRVSNDNPMSEAQFKTMKYQPDYPRRFDDYHHAQTWCEDYVLWYNTQHHHSGLGGFTPQQVFTGEHQDIAKTRQDALDKAYQLNPNRFRNGPPKVTHPPKIVTINPIPDDAEVPVIEKGVNFPTLKKAMENQH